MMAVSVLRSNQYLGSPSSARVLGKFLHNPNPYSYNVCSAADAATFGIKYPFPGFCGDFYQAIAPYPQLAMLMDTYYYDHLYYVGLPLAQSYYDSMVIDLKKRAGKGLTMNLNYTLSRQEGNTYTAFQKTWANYTTIQDFSNIAQVAHTITDYDQTHVVKGFVSYDLPFGRGRQWMSDHGRWVNGLIGGWTVAGLVLYTSGQPLRATVPNPYYAVWGNIYPNFDLSGFSGPIFQRGQYTPPTAANPRPAQDYYLPAGIVSAPAYGQLGTGPSAMSALRCPGLANESASILKNFSMGSDGRYKLSFRTEFYKPLQPAHLRHQWMRRDARASLGRTTSWVRQRRQQFAADRAICSSLHVLISANRGQLSVRGLPYSSPRAGSVTQ